MHSFSVLTILLRVLSTIVAVVYVYFKWSYQYWKKRNIPYLEPTIPFGNVENPFRKTMSVGQNISHLYNKAKTRGWKYCGFYSVATPTLMILDLELLKQVLTKDFDHFVDRGVYTNEKDDPISAHLFAIGGAKWRNLRMKLTPTFTSGKMKNMFQTLVDCGIVLENYMEEIVKVNETVDIKDILGKFSTDIIGSCAFGLDCNSFKNSNSPFRTYGKRVFERGKFAAFQLLFNASFPNLARFLRCKQFSKEIGDFFIKVVEDTVAYREKNNIERKDFLQMLIEIKNNKESNYTQKGDGKSLTMLELAAQSFVFFVAGFETSSTTMTFVLFRLATCPAIQDKVRNEINTVLTKYDNQITYDSINDLKYMKQVIDETLRMYPPVPFITRECVQDYKMPGEENIIIEKGTKIMIPILGLHFDKEYYEYPEEFNPERFSKDKKKAIHQYAYIPFGEGPRICIGERFGVMQTKVGLTCLLRKFKVSLNSKTKVPLEISKNNFITSVETGIWLDMEML